jgi:hypothetical protein
MTIAPRKIAGNAYRKPDPSPPFIAVRDIPAKKHHRNAKPKKSNLLLYAKRNMAVTITRKTPWSLNHN